MLSIKVSAKNQVAVPAEARRRLRIVPGDRLSVEIRDETMILRRMPARASQRLRGLGREVWAGRDPVAYVRALRDEFGRDEPADRP